jgi:hypothetical protein
VNKFEISLNLAALYLNLKSKSDDLNTIKALFDKTGKFGFWVLT